MLALSKFSKLHVHCKHGNRDLQVHSETDFFSHCPTHPFPKEIWNVSGEKREKVEDVFVLYNLKPFMYKTFIPV